MLDVSDGRSSVDSSKDFYMEYESSDKNISGFQGEKNEFLLGALLFEITFWFSNSNSSDSRTVLTMIELSIFVIVDDEYT